VLHALAVLDASFLVKLVLREDCSSVALRLFREAVSREEGAHVPCIVFGEVANAVWKHLTLLHDIDVDIAEKALSMLGKLQRVIRVHSIDKLLIDAFHIASTYRLTVYDSLYVALAARLGQKLYTFDRKLVEQSEGLGVRVILPDC